MYNYDEGGMEVATTSSLRDIRAGVLCCCYVMKALADLYERRMQGF